MTINRGAYQRRRFAGGWDEQERRIRALRASALRDMDGRVSRIANKLENCSFGAVVERSHCGGHVRVCDMRCRSRLCVRCSRIRARQLAAKMTTLCRTMDAPRFLTLTIRSQDEPLGRTIERLQRAFKLLRRTKAWKQHVRGGFYAIEITYNHRTERWHPHLHAVVDGQYFEQKKLLAAWEQCVGDQAGAHIKAVHSASSIARYVTSYVCKTSDVTKMPEDHLATYANATHGLRMCQTFGSCHGIRMDAENEDADREGIRWQFWRMADDVASAADRGSEDAKKLLQAAWKRQADVIADELDAWCDAVEQALRRPVVRQPTRKAAQYGLQWEPPP